MGVEVGQPAPDFALPGIRLVGDQIERETYRLSEHRGHPIVLAFYPLDQSRTCTKQLCSYEDAFDGFDAVGAQVWGISIQGVESHEEFARANGLHFPLLADRPGGVGSEYGVMVARLMMRRSIFIIDGDGIVRWKHVSAVGLGYRTAEEIRAHLLELFASPTGGAYNLPAPV